MPHFSSSLALRDYLKPFLRCLPARQRRRFFALCRGLLQSRSSILSRAGRTRLRRKEGMHSRLDAWVRRMSLLLKRLPWPEFHAAHVRRLLARQGRWQLVIHDGSDIAKPWAKKLDGLSMVRDGSTGEIVNGYTFCMSIGVGKEPWDIHPIAATLVNPHADSFTTGGSIFKAHIRDMLRAGIGLDLLHVFDRGFDDEKYFWEFDHEEMAWMVRLKDNRIVTFRGERHPITLVAETILRERPMVRDRTIYARTDIGITITHDGTGKKIPPETRTYTLVAVKRSQYERPMLLLVNGRVKKLGEAVKLYENYLDRWEVEDCFRFFKQSLRIEQMQLRTFERLECFLWLQLLLMDFILREYDHGVRPPGADLREVLLRSIENDTRILSPYLLADHIGDTLLSDQRQRDPDLVPCTSPQLSLLPIMDTE